MKQPITSESIRDDIYVGMALFDFGYLHRQTENWAAAIELILNIANICIDNNYVNVTI